MPHQRRKETAAAALGRRVRQLRDAKGWSQERLAEHANLDRSYVAGIEVGVRNPSLNALERLAQALSVRLAGLFEEAPAIPPAGRRPFGRSKDGVR